MDLRAIGRDVVEPRAQVEAFTTQFAMFGFDICMMWLVNCLCWLFIYVTMVVRRAYFLQNHNLCIYFVEILFSLRCMKLSGFHMLQWATMVQICIRVWNRDSWSTNLSIEFFWLEGVMCSSKGASGGSCDNCYSWPIYGICYIRPKQGCCQMGPSMLWLGTWKLGTLTLSVKSVLVDEHGGVVWFFTVLMEERHNVPVVVL